LAGLGKQAKVLSEGQIKAALAAAAERRYPERDRVMVLQELAGHSSLATT
jgi:hypothetical protein